MITEIARDSRVYSTWETRWYSLDSIIEFALDNHMKLLNLGIIIGDDLLTLLKFKIIFKPLFNLHGEFEKSAARLCDIFPLVMNCIHDLLTISFLPLFQAAWLYAIRTVLFYLFHYFLDGDRGELFALAYYLHPLGMKMFHDSRFMFCKMRFPVPMHYSEQHFTTSRPFYTPEQLSAQFRPGTSEVESSTTPSTTTTITTATSSPSTLLSTSSATSSSKPQQRHIHPLTSAFAARAINLFLKSEPTVPEMPKDELDMINPVIKSLLEQCDRILTSLSLPAERSKPPSTSESTEDDETDFVDLLTEELDQQSRSLSLFISESSKDKAYSPPSTSTLPPVSHIYSTRTRGFTTVPDTDEPIITSAGEMESTRQQLANIRKPPPYKNEVGEREYISCLQSLIEQDWEQRVMHGFIHFLSEHLISKAESLHTGLVGMLESFLSPPLISTQQNSEKFYWMLSLGTPLQALFAYLASIIIHSPCSEASCERIFSTAKNIIGDRRYSMKLTTLTILVQALVETRM